MPVLKNKTQGRYVNVCKGILENRSFGLRDRGMLVTLLSFPDNWDFSIAGLAKILPDGKSAISASLERLIQMGYVTKEQERTAFGKFGMNVIEVHETPIVPLPEKPLSEKLPTEKPLTKNMLSGNPSAEKQAQVINKKVTNKESMNKQVIHKESDTLCDRDYKELCAKFGKESVDYQIRKIQEKHYKGCMNRRTIEQWCMEYQTKVKPPQTACSYNSFPQRTYDWEALERELLARSYQGMEGGAADVS